MLSIHNIKSAKWSYTLERVNNTITVRLINNNSSTTNSIFHLKVCQQNMYTTTTNKVSSVRDVTIAGPPRCPVWCRLVTVPTDPFTTFTSPTGPFLSEWATCQLGNTQNGRLVLRNTNLMVDSKAGSPVS